MVPEDEAGLYAMNGILDDLYTAGIPPYLVVVKKFGSVRSPGVMSFPVKGITFAIDIPNQGQHVLDTLSRCDARLLECGGRVYPAKDARMSARDFQRMYPDWTTLEQVRDPAFMSTFWKRVTHT